MFNLSESVIKKISEQLGAPPVPHFAAYPPKNISGCPMWAVAVNFQRKQAVQEIDLRLEQVRQSLAKEPVLAYKSIQCWYSIRETGADQIVVCPATDQFDIIRFEWGEKSGSSTDAEYYIGKLRDLDARYGIELAGAGYQTIEFALRNVPQRLFAEDLIRELNGWGGSVQEGIANARTVPFDWEHESPDDLLKDFDFGDGRVALWFD